MFCSDCGATDCFICPGVCARCAAKPRLATYSLCQECLIETSVPFRSRLCEDCHENPIGGTYSRCYSCRKKVCSTCLTSPVGGSYKRCFKCRKCEKCEVNPVKPGSQLCTPCQKPNGPFFFGPNTIVETNQFWIIIPETNAIVLYPKSSEIPFEPLPNMKKFKLSSN
jgi:hypothetical protein